MTEQSAAGDAKKPSGETGTTSDETGNPPGETGRPAAEKRAGKELTGVRDARAQAYYDQLEDPMRTVALAARTLLLSTAPQLDEVLKWGLPIYGQPKNIMSIVAHRNWVNFQFFNGAHLSRHPALIQGEGKNLRHVKLHGSDDVTDPALRELIEESLALGFDAQR